MSVNADDVISDFQNLQVLKYNGNNVERMNDLVRDLSSALSESADLHCYRTKHDELLPPGGGFRRMIKKYRGRKRRPRVYAKTEGGNISEASESSLDDAIHVPHMNSDSDGMLEAALTRMSVAQFACSLPESDSVTENISPNRQHRRRRKFKHIVMDTEPVSNVLNLSKTFLRPVSQKSMECDKSVYKIPSISIKSDSYNMFGKRKRNAKEHNLDIDYIDDRKCGNCFAAQEFLSPSKSRHSSSSLSSESELELSHGEGGEGDDEQSDFFNEAGPVMGYSMWNDNKSNFAECTDCRSIENNMDQLERPIKSGKRRLGHLRQRYSMSHFIADRQQWKTLNDTNNGIKSHSNYSKRPKKSFYSKHDCLDDHDLNPWHHSRNQSSRNSASKSSQKSSPLLHL